MSYAFHLPNRLIVAAMLLDVAIGDPRSLLHPVKLIGRAVAYGERCLQTGNRTRDLIGGAILTFAVVAGSALATYLVIVALGSTASALGAISATLVAYTTLAARGLNDAARAVEQSLRRDDIVTARDEIRALVGRDPDALEREGLIRAAIESVAENSSDGIIAPLFYLFIGGPVATIAYKAINTLDSMIGYKNERYLYFGRFAARLDDLANLIPARLTALGIAVAAAVITGRGAESIRVCRADARKHESPNAGYPEAAMAGALGVQLGGDAVYAGEVQHGARFGVVNDAPAVEAIRTARILMWMTTALMLTVGLVARRLAESMWRSWW